MLLLFASHWREETISTLAAGGGGGECTKLTFSSLFNSIQYCRMEEALLPFVNKIEICQER